MLSRSVDQSAVAIQLAAARTEMEVRIRGGRLGAADELREQFPVVWEDTEAVLELVYTEYVLRRANGEAPDRTDWFRRYLDMSDRLDRLFGLYDLMAGHDTAGGHQVGTVPGAEKPPATPPAEHPDGYEILDEIGRGGMAMVYKARQVALNRVVAVKVLRGGGWFRDEDTARIRREAEAVARLQHPHIVQIHEVGEWDGEPFLALEYVPGGTLADALARPHRQGTVGIPADTAAGLVETLARAMQHAHEQGIVHRDLKPANVLLAHGPDGPFAHPKIADFGLAVAAELDPSVSQSAALVGTPCYMAPEQANSQTKAVGPCTDVYSLGGILYELLTGRPPFQGATVLETLDLVRQSDPVRPRLLRPKLPRDLETICLKCLEKDQTLRYPSAASLADDLARFRDRRPITARPVGIIERGWKWCQRRPLVAGMLCGLIAAVLVAVILPSLFWGQAEDGRKREAGLRRAAEEGEQREAGLRHKAEEREAKLLLKTARLQWLDHDLTGARESLTACDEAHRNAEWESLWRASRPPIAWIQMGPPSDVPYRNATAFIEYSPCGQVVAVIQADGRLRVCDAKTGEVVHTWSGVAPTVYTQSAISSPKQLYFAFKAVGNKAKSYIHAVDLSTGKAERLWEIDPPILETAVSDDGRHAAYLSNGKIRVFDLIARKELASFTDLGTEPTRVHFAFATKGPYLVTYLTTGEVKVWDMTTRHLVHEISPPPEEPLAKVVAVSSDGRRVAYLTTSPNVLSRLLLRSADADSSSVIIPTGFVEGTRTRFSPDAKIVAVSSRDGGFISVWDTATGREVIVLRGHRERVFQFAFNPDSKHLAVGCAGGRVAIWDVTPNPVFQ